MIRVLEDRVVNQIAAGEVVERPASALKELVENALDAGARTLEIDLRSGGRSLVRVADDGRGMDRADATLCIERHATSKISSTEDLFSVGTLGFRGEAVPSIAAVSRFEILTRRPQDTVGTRVVLEGGRLVRIEDSGGPAGTSVSVRSLFFNLPARRKFLRTVKTELSHCLESVVRAALPRPDLDVTLRHDGTGSIRAPRVADVAARAGDLLGPHGRALVPVSFSSGDLSVEALLSPVGVHKASARGATYLYVNGRFVSDPLVKRAVREAYRSLVPKGRHPPVVIQITVPPEHVDVNVHPSKTEVRFRHGRELGQALSNGLRTGLQRHGIQRPVEARASEHIRPDTVPSTPQRLAFPAAPQRFPPPVPLQRTPQPAWPTARQHPTATQPPAEVALDPPNGEASTHGLLPVPRFVDLRVLGQLATTYVLCEGRGELVIIDQHAAHERVTLDRLTKARRARLGAGQRLLTPLVVELTPARAAALAARLDVLAEVGMEVEPFGGASVAIKQVPEALAGVDPVALVHDIADDLAEGGPGRPAEAVVDGLLNTLACHGSVRAGRTLSPYEMRELLRSLDAVDFEVCAHGRPVCIRVSPGELERRFHRS